MMEGCEEGSFFCFGVEQGEPYGSVDDGFHPDCEVIEGFFEFFDLRGFAFEGRDIVGDVEDGILIIEVDVYRDAVDGFDIHTVDRAEWLLTGGVTYLTSGE